jgi:hypothetical protein
MLSCSDEFAVKPAGLASRSGVTFGVVLRFYKQIKTGELICDTSLPLSSEHNQDHHYIIITIITTLPPSLSSSLSSPLLPSP